MADASVTIKLNPREFDLVRESVVRTRDEYERISRDREQSPQVRREAQGKAVQLGTLHETFSKS